MEELKIWEEPYDEGVGECYYNDEGVGECYYNVDKFLRFINSRGQKWHHRLNSFTTALEKKVSINKSDPKIEPIYDGINCIVKGIAISLKENLSHFYGELEVIPTGSQTSRVKVGLPHEADFLFNLQNTIDTTAYERDSETDFTELLCKDIARVIDDGIISNQYRLRIHGIHPHEFIPGVCIVMSYGEGEESRVGVTMDIVLVTPFHPKCSENLPLKLITSKSLLYIKDKGVFDYFENRVYSLLGRMLF